MAKVAVLMAEGFEESETIVIVDVLRRLNITCDTFAFNESFVLGMNGMRVKADRLFSDALLDYDVLVLPGGRPGGDNLLSNPKVINLVIAFNTSNKYIAAMCSGTTVLAHAGVIHSKKVTGYTGYEEKLKDGIFVNDVVVHDKNIITSQGPATPFPFAFKIAEVLGVDTTDIKEQMMYNFAKGR